MLTGEIRASPPSETCSSPKHQRDVGATGLWKTLSASPLWTLLTRCPRCAQQGVLGAGSTGATYWRDKRRILYLLDSYYIHLKESSIPPPPAAPGTKRNANRLKCLPVRPLPRHKVHACMNYNGVVMNCLMAVTEGQHKGTDGEVRRSHSRVDP